MDTKLKSNKKWLGNLICMFLILAVSAGTLLCYQRLRLRVADMFEELDEEKDDWKKEELTSFVDDSYLGNYCLYWNIRQKIEDKYIEPFSLFYPSYARFSDSEDEYEWDYFNENFVSLSQNYEKEIYERNINYQVTDNETGEYLNNSSKDISKESIEDYAFYLKCSFDEKGAFAIDELKNNLGCEAEELSLNANKPIFTAHLESDSLSSLPMDAPKNITVYLVSDYGDCYLGDSLYYGNDNYNNYLKREAVKEAGLNAIVAMFSMLLAAAGLILPLRKRWEIGNGIFGKLPLEIVSCLACTPFMADSLMADEIVKLFEGTANYFWGMPYVVQMGMWACYYAVWFVMVLSARAVFTLGPKRYFLERIWTVALARWFWKKFSNGRKWIWNKCRGFVRWIINKGKAFFRLCVVTLDDIDLTDPSDRLIFKILGLNFVIVFFCCVLWFYGTMGLLLYTIILFFILKKYARNIKEKYGILLRSTKKMAEGDLQTEITEELGIFEPLKVELNKVQNGFRKAVEEEIKSQNLKTELITNVSHDLKTPLTAIITYVNLLKNEGISEEERSDYINILDRKSFRLKQLIEDLFEVSKASSGNIKVEKKLLNLTELVKQAVFELEDRLKEADVECRISTPKEDVFLMLDGEKTYRCLENLLINVAKYSMPKTRAYLNLYDREDYVELIIKNVSKEELPLDVEAFTERFMRGDKSRNTEGSGLGLAIVKSFVKIQGGVFHVEGDGDLFKANIRFSKG